VKSERESNCQGFLRSSNVFLIIYAASSNVHVQHLTLLKARKAAAAPPPAHGEERVQPGGACCSVSVYTVNPNLPINNFCSTPDFFPECTE